MSAPVVVPAERSLANSPLAHEQAGIDACVHCGFCLQSCPTYLTLEDENDSPRGRILLMRMLLDGTLDPASETIDRHISRCLGCRACETVCPSGVPYGQLLEATRATLTRYRPIPLAARFILSLFERPALMRAAMAAGRLLRATGLPRLLARLPGRIGFGMAMLASTKRENSHRTGWAASGGERGNVAVLTGCVMEGLFAGVNRATERVLQATGYQLRPAAGQRCCGALHAHAGDAAAARRLAKANIEAFERAAADHVCVNAAGCGAIMKEYPHLLADEPEWRRRAESVSRRVRDVSELLAVTGPPPGGPVSRRVAYDAPCHLVHAQRVAAAPLAVLRAIPALDLVPLAESDVCCGSAGIYNLIEPETSDVVLRRKLDNIRAAAPELVVTGNPGCLMQIGAGLLRDRSAIATVHPVELLDESYAQRHPA